MNVAAPVFEGKVNTHKTGMNTFMMGLAYNTASAFGEKVILGGTVALLLTVFALNIVNSDVILKFLEDTFFKNFQHNMPDIRQSLQEVRIDVNGNSFALYKAFLYLIRRLKKGGMIAVLTVSFWEYGIAMQAYKFLEVDSVCTKVSPVCVCVNKQKVEVLRKDRKILN